MNEALDGARSKKSLIELYGGLASLASAYERPVGVSWRGTRSPTREGGNACHLPYHTLCLSVYHQPPTVYLMPRQGIIIADGLQQTSKCTLPFVQISVT